MTRAKKKMVVMHPLPRVNEIRCERVGQLRGLETITPFWGSRQGLSAKAVLPKVPLPGSDGLCCGPPGAKQPGAEVRRLQQC